MVKAIGLLSGGLDSTLAAKVVNDLGVDVQGIFFEQLFGCGHKDKVIEWSDSLDINLKVFHLKEDYLKLLQKPKFGYGTAFNPCVDCHIYMCVLARQYMEEVGADFVFTGEVLGQRPMSQLLHNLRNVEKESGLDGRLLRPLSAKLLDATIPEQEGMIDRNRLFAISGRSRKEQIKLAKEFNIVDYGQPAGGCILTDENFARKMRDIFKHGYRDLQEIIQLKWGRHFRFSQKFKAIVGRDETENDLLVKYAHRDDYIFEFVTETGPTVILKGENPTRPILETAAGLVQKFSKFRDMPPLKVMYRATSVDEDRRLINAGTLHTDQIDKMRI